MLNKEHLLWWSTWWRPTLRVIQWRRYPSIPQRRTYSLFGQDFCCKKPDALPTTSLTRRVNLKHEPIGDMPIGHVQWFVLLLNFHFLSGGFQCWSVCVCVCVCTLSRVWLFVTPRTVACQSPLSMGFPRLKYWNGLLFLSPGDLSISAVGSMCLTLASGFFTTETQGKPFHK